LSTRPSLAQEYQQKTDANKNQYFLEMESFAHSFFNYLKQRCQTMMIKRDKHNINKKGLSSR
jgi:hypothetical protein